ncbi:MAG: hypothetical protein ACJARZ_001459 [Dokdonia sp.]|jgi:hypothetical protein
MNTPLTIELLRNNSIRTFLLIAVLGINTSFAQTSEFKTETINTNKEVIFGAGVHRVGVSMWGGGAGGNAGGYKLNGNEDIRQSGSGGGASSWAGKRVSVIKDKTYSVIVGKGGAKGVYNSSNDTASEGRDGTASSFGDHTNLLVRAEGGYSFKDRNGGNFSGGEAGKNTLPSYDCSGQVWPQITGLEVHTETDRFVSINWDNLPGAFSYIVVYKPVSGDASTSLSQETSVSSITINNLRADTEYEFQLIATYKYTGYQRPSTSDLRYSLKAFPNTISGYFTTIPTLPSIMLLPPFTLGSDNISTNSATINATLLSHSGNYKYTPGYNDYNYTLEYKASSSSTWIILPETTITGYIFSRNITSLLPNTKYDCRIRSDFSGNIYQYTEFATLPGSNIIGLPSNPMVYGLDSRSALLTWDHVDGANGYEINVAIEGDLFGGHTAWVPKGQNWYFENGDHRIQPNKRTSFSIKASNATVNGSTHGTLKGSRYCYPYADEGDSGSGLNGGNGGLANLGWYGLSSDLSKQYGGIGRGSQNIPRDNSGYGPGQSPIELWAMVYGGVPTQNAVNPGNGGGGGGMETYNIGRLFQMALLGPGAAIIKGVVRPLFNYAVNSVDMSTGDEFNYGTDGGTGADGVVNLYYTCPIYKFTSPPVTSRICGNSGSSTITVFSKNMPDGRYVITYNSSSPSFNGKTAEMYFENGSGNFPTATIQDNSLITITAISSGTTCNNVVDDYNTVRTVVNNSSTTEINASVVENVCQGQTITVPYFIGCKTFNAGNQFSLELSQPDGSFATSVPLKTALGTRSGEIEAIIPTNLPTGSKYRVRVNGSSPYTQGSDNGRDIIIGRKAGPITASSSVNGSICEGNSINLFSAGNAVVQDTAKYIAFQENFNGSINAWRKINESIGGTPENAAWNIKPDNYKHYYNGYADKNIRFSDRTSFMYVSSNLQSNTTTGSKGITRSTLESPVFSTAGMATAKLSLNTAYLYAGNITEAYSAIRIEISKNGTDWAKLYERRNQYQNTWTTSTSLLNDWNSGLYKPILLEIPLDDYVNESQLQVRFVYETEFRSSSLSFWAIDDVKIHTEFIPDRITWSSEPVGFSSNLLNPDAFVPTETTSYRVVRMNEFGCTSTEQIAVSVNESSASFTDLSVCSSELPYTWNGLVFQGAGVKTAKLVNGVGCDSLATLNLGINDSYSFQNVSICSSQLPYTWNDLTFTKTERQTAILVNAFGCDSSATLSLKVSDTGSTTNKSICNADFPFVWNGITISEPGTQMATFTNSVGCDSIATLNLSLSSEDVIVETNYTTACEGTLIALTPILKNDSAKLILEGFNNISNNWKSRNLNILDTDVKGAWVMYPDNYVFREIRTYQSNDRSQFYLSSAYDAATDVETNVSLESPEFSTQGYTASELRFFHTFDGGPYDSIKVEISRNSGVTWQSIYKYSNQTGSTIGNIGQSDRFIEKVIPLTGYLNYDGLKIRFVHKAVGYGGRWAIDNVKITGAVDVVYNWSSVPAGFNSNLKDPSFTMGSENSEVFLTVTNIDNCQSTSSLQVISKEGEITTSNTTQTICSSQLPFKWNGLTFVADGTQTAILKNSVGCDSLATLVLSVQASSTSVTDMVACNEYLWNGITYTENGTYTFETQNAIGCDSIATLNLVLNSNSSETNISICSSDLGTFIWNGLSFTESSTKSVVLTNALGCDSTAVINLSVSPLVEVSASDTILCAGDLINLTANLADGASQLILEEKFNGPLSNMLLNEGFNGISNDWERRNLNSRDTDAKGAWTTFPDNYVWRNLRTYKSNDRSQFYLSDAYDAANGVETNVSLESPEFSTIGVTSSELRFFHTLEAGPYDSIKVEISRNSGVTWQSLYKYSNKTGSTLGNIGQSDWFVEKVIPLTDYLNEDGLKIRFVHIVDGYGGRWAIDNVTISKVVDPNANWKITNNSTSNAGWEFYDAVGYQSRVSSDHSQFIGVNTIIESGSNLTSTILASPVIDASAYKTLRLNFEQDFLNLGATAKIEASDNNGASWSTVYSLSSYLGFSTTEVNLDTYAGKPNVKIRFKFDETGRKGWWFIDNVKFTGLLKQKFTWTSNPVNFTSTEQNPEITDLQESTMFKVLAANTEGCFTEDSVFVKVNPTSNSQVNLVLCPESFPYVWEDQTFTEAGSKTITLTNTFGCDSVVTLTINESPIPLNVIVTVDNSILCGADSISLSSSSSPSLAVNILTQNFDGQETGMLTENLSTGGSPENSSWSIVSDGHTISSYDLHSPDASSFYLSNSNAQAGGIRTQNFTTETMLTSSSFSTVGFDSVYLSFDHYYKAFNRHDSITVEVSLNEGVQWSKVLLKRSSVGTENSFNAEKVKLNDFLNEPRVMVRFRFKAEAGGWWAIDKFSINGILRESQYAWSIAGGDVFSALRNPVEKVLPLETTTYSVNETNSLGCSVSNSFEVTVNNSTDTLSKSICASEFPYTWGGLEFLEEGVQTAHLTRLNGCDSTVVLELKEFNVPHSTTTVTLCENLLPFAWNGQSFGAEGIYNVVLNSNLGCDSTAVLNLKINPVPTSLLATASDIQICNGNSVNLSGSNVLLTKSSILTESLNDANILWIATNQSVGGDITSANWERQQDAYDYKSTVFGSNDNSAFYLSNSDSQGAGSNTLTYLESPVFSTVGYTDLSLSFYHHFKQISSTDTISVEITKDNGANWELAYQHHSSNIGSANAFENKVVVLNNFIDESSVKLRFVYKGSFGQHWAIDNIEITGTTLGENYQWRSLPIGFSSSELSPTSQVSPTETTEYFLQATNGLGCIVEKKITVEVLKEVSSTDLTICSTELPYLWNGITFNETGSQTARIVDDGGCASDATLNLTVLNTSSSITNTTICENELPYNWNGLALTRSGSSVVSLTNAQGCDSLATLNLKVNSLPLDILASSSVSEIILGGSVTLASSANSKVVNETFNLPLENWVMVNDGTGAQVSSADWTIKESGIGNITTPDGSPYIVSNAVIGSGNITDVKLESPSFKPVDYDNLSLEFDQVFFARTSSGEFIKVQVSTDNGSNWTDVYTATTDVGAGNQFVHTTISLNAFLNEAQLKIRFYYKVDGGRFWALDNVILKGTNDQNLIYSWSSEPTGFSSGTQNPGLVSPTDDIDYIVAVSNGLSCLTSDTVSIKVHKPTSSVNDLSICESELPYTWNGLTFTDAGTQSAVLTNAAGSDSTATLSLTVFDALYSYTREVICPSELPFSWNGLSINSAGSHSVNLISNSGCDSIAYVILELSPEALAGSAGISNSTVCYGDLVNLSSNFDGSGYSTLHQSDFEGSSSNWIDINLTTQDASSTPTWELVSDGYFAGIYNLHTNDNSQMYINEESTYNNGKGYLESPFFSTQNYTSADLDFHHFFWKYNSEDEIKVQITTDDGLTWNTIYAESENSVGSHSNFANQVISLNGYLNKPRVKLRFHVNASGNGFWAIDNVRVKAESELNNTYSWTSSNTDFTSSIRNLLNISPEESTRYSLAISNNYGCVTTKTADIVVNSNSTSFTNLNICESALPYTWNSISFTEGGGKVAILTNSVGCDSIANLNLIVNKATTSETIMEVCEGFLPFVWNGNNYNSSGTYTYNTLNAKGCDSTATLILKINADVKNLSVSASNNTICPGTEVDLFSSPDSKNSFVLISEDFNSLVNDWKTFNWEILPKSDIDFGDWTLSPDAYNNYSRYSGGLHSNDNSQFYFSTAYDKALLKTSLESPVFSLEGLTAASLSFFHFHEFQYDTLQVEVSKDLGNSWLPLYFNNSASEGLPNAFKKTTLSLDSFLGEETLMIRYVFESKYGDWAIDNVTVEGVNEYPITYSWSSSTSGVFSAISNPKRLSPTESTVYTLTASSSNGCSATGTTSVILTSGDISASTSNHSICSSELPYTWNGLLFETAGSQSAHLVNAAGCDSSATLNLTVNQVSSSFSSIAACGNYLWNGVSYTQSGTYQFITNNGAGCDSTAIIDLTINPLVTSLTANIDNAVLCLNEPMNLTANAFSETAITLLEENFNAQTNNWTVLSDNTGGDIYHSPWTRRIDGYVEYSEFHSPDSSPFYIASSNLQGSSLTRINTSLVSPTFNTIGLKEVTLDFNQYYTGYQTNDRIRVEVSVDGGTNWTILYSNQNTFIGSSNAFVNETLPMNDYLGFSDVKLRFNYFSLQKGFYWAIDDVTVSGIAELEHTYSWTSAPASFGSNEQNPSNILPRNSGQYVVTSTNSLGCSATQAVNVSVGTSSNDKTVKELCSSELPFMWNGTEYTSSGIYTYDYVNGSICASVDTLDLTINQSTNVTEIASTCTSYTWNGNNYTSSGEYFFSYTNAKGCASVDTLKLAVALPNVVVDRNIVSGFEHIKSVNNIESNKVIGHSAAIPKTYVIFEAGKSILLLPGFKVEEQHTFKAEIKACED